MLLLEETEVSTKLTSLILKHELVLLTGVCPFKIRGEKHHASAVQVPIRKFQTGLLINNTNLFLTVLGTETQRSGCQAWSV